MGVSMGFLPLYTEGFPSNAKISGKSKALTRFDDQSQIQIWSNSNLVKSKSNSDQTQSNPNPTPLNSSQI
ncbi:unnamed protein product [Adineta ricciae]|uniref:Uncharacterized protein n=1 Tax=Adineta ricciae TaxID=249248 RepID=A0A816EN50_ADIRI|nr:unnamed protein product [Adineta ricciae]